LISDQPPIYIFQDESDHQLLEEEGPEEERLDKCASPGRK
jgi:hypothetical protein